MELDVNVTIEHIGDGIRRHPCRCPVALAVREALGLPYDPASMYVSVGSDRVNIGTQRYHLPRPVADWVWEYDNGHPVEPFSFRLTDADAYPVPETEDDESTGD